MYPKFICYSHEVPGGISNVDMQIKQKTDNQDTILILVTSQETDCPYNIPLDFLVLDILHFA